MNKWAYKWLKINNIFKGDFIMKKTYKIDVDCANCANKMEDAANKTAGVKNAVEDECWIWRGCSAEGCHAGSIEELQEGWGRLWDFPLRQNEYGSCEIPGLDASDPGILP